MFVLTLRTAFTTWIIELTKLVSPHDAFSSRVWQRARGSHDRLRLHRRKFIRIPQGPHDRRVRQETGIEVEQAAAYSGDD